MKAHFVSNARVCGDWPRPHTRRRGRYSSLPRSKSTGLIIWTCTAASDSSGHARTRKSMNKIVRKTTDVTLRRRHSIDQHRSLSWKGSFCGKPLVNLAQPRDAINASRAMEGDEKWHR